VAVIVLWIAADGALKANRPRGGVLPVITTGVICEPNEFPSDSLNECPAS
jgi:hypothetical protein